MSPAEVTEKLGLHRMRDRSWYVHPRYVISRLRSRCRSASHLHPVARQPGRVFSRVFNGFRKMSRSNASHKRTVDLISKIIFTASSRLLVYVFDMPTILREFVSFPLISSRVQLCEVNITPPVSPYLSPFLTLYAFRRTIISIPPAPSGYPPLRTLSLISFCQFFSLFVRSVSIACHSALFSRFLSYSPFCFVSRPRLCLIYIRY